MESSQLRSSPVGDALTGECTSSLTLAPRAPVPAPAMGFAPPWEPEPPPVPLPGRLGAAAGVLLPEPVTAVTFVLLRISFCTSPAPAPLPELGPAAAAPLDAPAVEGLPANGPLPSVGLRHCISISTQGGCVSAGGDVIESG